MCMNRVITFILILLVLIPMSVFAIKIDPSVTFDGVGNEKIRKCPSFNCEVIKYGGYFTFVEIIESSGDWYKVRYTERSSSYANRNNPLIPYQEHIPVELPRSQWTTTVGWMYYSVIPDSILLKLRGEDYKNRKNGGEVIGVAVLKKQSDVLNCPSSNNCTLLEILDAGTSLEVIDIDNTGKWYKIKLDDPVILDWDKWVRASDFVDKPVQKSSSSSAFLATTSSSVASKKEFSYLDIFYNFIELTRYNIEVFVTEWNPFK